MVLLLYLFFQSTVYAVRAAWSWLQQASICMETHLRNAAAYHQVCTVTSERIEVLRGVASCISMLCSCKLFVCSIFIITPIRLCTFHWFLCDFFLVKLSKLFMYLFMNNKFVHISKNIEIKGINLHCNHMSVAPGTLKTAGSMSQAFYGTCHLPVSLFYLVTP